MQKYISRKNIFNDWNEDKIKYHQELQRVYIYNVSTPFQITCSSAFDMFLIYPSEGWYEGLILKSCKMKYALIGISNWS